MESQQPSHGSEQPVKDETEDETSGLQKDPFDILEERDQANQVHDFTR